MERITKQGTAILEAIKTAGRPLLSNEILQISNLTVPGMGQATVYRNLKSLLDRDEIQEVILPGENPRYEIAESDHQHHHHFQCKKCDKVYDVHACPGDCSILAPTGFVVENHELILYGTCVKCMSKKKPKKN